MNNKAKIAILKWEEGLVPMGLMQLESLVGNSTNKDSYPFLVEFVSVPGACAETVIINPSEEVLNRMISIGRGLQSRGIRAVSTSCGFNAVFQQKLACALDIPVFSSALLQVPFVQQIIGVTRTVAIITANKASLTKEHLRACGITDDMNVEVYGLELSKEWNTIFENPDKPFNMKCVEDDIIKTAKQAVSSNDSIGAIVLECTDLPPFAAKIREATGLPVFDFNSMAAYMAISLGDISIY